MPGKTHTHTSTHKKESLVSVLVTKKRATQEHKGLRKRKIEGCRESSNESSACDFHRRLCINRIKSRERERKKEEQVNYFDAFRVTR